MIKLQPGNCSFKPSQRRQLLSSLKRCAHLGERVGDFVLTITMRRIGKVIEMVATVHDAAGDFAYRARGRTWRDVCRDLARTLASRLHGQRLHAQLG